MHNIKHFDEEEQKIISEDYVDLIVENNAALKRLLAETDKIILGCEFELRLAIIYVKKDMMNRVQRELNVQSNLSYPLLFGVLDMDSLDETNISQVQTHPTLELKGRGVLVGFIDTGIDYTHPAFIYEDGTTKIKTIWDQTIFTGDHPQGFKYGTEYKEEQINEALRSEDPFSVVSTHDVIGHGTFLAGVVAGREPGKYLGVAPESEILCVKLAPAKRASKENNMIYKEDAVVFQDINILMGLLYLINKAKELDRPLSITLGLGTTQGGHDGNTYSSITGNIPGLVVTSACGNEGNTMGHAEGTIKKNGDTYDLEFTVDERDKGLAVYIWGYAPDKLSISLMSPSGEYIQKVSVRNTAQASYRLIFYDTIIWINYFFAADSNGDQLTVVRFKNPEYGTWKITVYGDYIIDGNFHAWLPPKDWIHDGTHFNNSSSDYTITELANSTHLLSVGAYNQVDQHVFVQSSRGPTRKGLMRPDILAPGVRVSGPLPNKTYGVKSGTSIAAAHVAGAAALLLQWGIVNGNYKNMNAQIIRSILIAGAKRLPNIKYPNTQYGFGQLDLLQSFKELNTIMPQGDSYFFDYYVMNQSNGQNEREEDSIVENSKEDNNKEDNSNEKITWKSPILNAVANDDATQSRAGLKVDVFAYGKTQPIANALVRIQDPNSGETIEELYTDNSGQIETIDLAAPPTEYALGGSDYNVIPYAQYNIEVSADGFRPTLIKGIQLLSGDISLQDVVLQYQTENIQQANTIQIASHTLWTSYPPKVPEDDIKSVIQPGGYVVLDNTVIPETIVVHDGLVDDNSAKDYYIPFKDYIKNVASCEIYSTWPRETIMANVLAILSFTLNRVFTEWYWSKGYPFTITSSTTVDHAFVYGRNTFMEISQVVDEVFTTYITKPNIQQPLFTQYCDGKKVSCPNWMSQWGSKELGDQGYNAVDILKQYYGNDIYLKQAEKVSGIPSSYAGISLRIESAGGAVSTIQTQLNSIGNNYPAIEKVRVDGVFGAGTKLAVEVFQKVFNLSIDGVVGFVTWYKISEIYVAVMKLAVLG